MSQVLQVNGNYLVKVSDGGTIIFDTGEKVGDVIVTGNLTVDNNLTIKGNLSLGDEGTDNILVLGEISSDLKPKISNLYDLGSTEKYWRSLYVSRLQNPLGNLTIKDLVEPVDPQDAATKNYVDTALGSVENVYYVAKGGNDLNDGKSLAKAKLTIKSAVEAATLDINNGYDTTIFVKSGDYTEDNPIRLPRKLSIYGDGLRATTVRPLNKKQDLFWVTNGNYIANITIKDHEAPAAAVAFPPPSEEYPPVSIYQSPYVQNCTSITTTGCGMRVDGTYTLGLKSMVLDAYTQYNQGGIGIHMLNRGNTQLVSAFTINCDIAFLCTAGGFCSLTNSNSSFGNFGLVADGVSEPLLSAVLQGSPLGIIGDTIVLNNLVQRPNVGDAVSFNGSTNYYTVTSAQELSAGNIIIEGPDFSDQPTEFRTARQIVLSGKDKIATDTIDFINDTYRYLDYNQFKCTRDTNLIIDAAIDDMALGTNYKSIQAGLSYSRLSAAVVREEQLEESLDALLFTKSEVLKLLSSDSTIQGSEYQRVDNNFNLIYSLFQNASAVNPPTPPAYEFNIPEGATESQKNARDIILANRDFLIQEGIAYIEANLTFNYDREICRRDIGLIIDAVGYDLMFGSNFRSITAGRSYYRAQASNVVGVQKTATIDAFKFLKQTLLDFLTNNFEAYESVESNMNLIIDILDQGLTAVPPSYTFTDPIDYDLGFKNARNLIESNREFIKAEVIEYIEQNYSSFVYNQETCQRDIGLIIDAVGYDLMFGSNFRSITAGRSYTRANASVVNSSQKTATIDAFSFLKNRLTRLVSDNAAAVSSIESNIDLIIDIFDNGLGSVPSRPYTIPNPTVYNTGFENARNLIEANRTFIKAEIVAYIADTYIGFTYETADCQRDIDYILDAVYYDMTYGGNLETLIAGNAYYSYGSSLIPGEETETLGAYDRLKDIIIDIAQNVLITKSSGNLESQVTGIPGTLAAANAAGQLIEDIRTIISTPETPPTAVPPNTSTVDSLLIASFNKLQNRKNIIKVEITDYIDDNYGFEYDKVSCQRDVDYILDAIYYDMTYGGNLETLIAGNAYYAFGTDIVNPGEETATLDTYAYMRDIIVDISQNNDVSELQTLVPQTFGDAGSLEAAEYSSSLIEDIRSIINQDPKPEIRYPDLRWVLPEFVTIHELFQDEKDDTQRLVTNYIDSRYFLLDYDRSVCQRDIGLIIDAIAYDLMFDSNFRTITAARSYWRGTAEVVTEFQRVATIDAFNKLKELLTPLVSEAGDLTSSNKVADLMDIILGVIADGLSKIPNIVVPNPVRYDENLENARNLIEANREFIKAEIVEFIDINYVIPNEFEYDQSSCERDIDYILDAVYYDLTYGGNLETLIAGRAYYSFNQTVIPGEEDATLASYAYLKTLILNIAQSIEVIPLQSNVEQSTGTGSDLESAEIAAELIETIRTIISEPTLAIEEISPETAWVEPILVARANILTSSKNTIKNQVTDYIDSNYNTNVVPFTYDREKCLRDVGLIVDALSWDLMYGSNFRSITAGRSYSRANASVVSDRQKQATIESYEILRDYAAELVSENIQAVQSVTDNMDMIIDIFDQGLTAIPEYVIPTPPTLNEGARRARDLINENKDFIIAQVIKYISDNQKSGLNYNKETCQRDIGLIIDAISYDMAFGSNFRSVTAGRAYYRANAEIVTTVQKAATIDALNHLKTLLENQVIGLPAVSLSVSTNMDLIIDIFDNGLSAVPENYSFPSPTGYDIGFRNARNLIEANREFIKAEVTAWLEYNYVDFDSNYDSATCQRDVGLIIDSVSYDLITGSNFASSVAGSAYYRIQSATVTGSQLLQTTRAIARAKELSVAYVDLSLRSTVGNSFDNVINILENGLGSIPDYVFPDNGTSTPTTVADSSTIRSRKSFYQTQVGIYLNTNYPIVWSNLGPEGQDICKRDIGYIVDAISYDVQYGGNYQSVVAGEAYYSFGTLQIAPGEKTATLDAYENLKSLIQADVPSSSSAVGNLINNIKSTIDTGTPPAKIYPSASGETAAVQQSILQLQTGKSTIVSGVTTFITDTFSSLEYDELTCQRDVDYILDAVYYDMTYGGNLETLIAGEAYYSFGTLQIDANDKSATVDVYRYMRDIIFSISQNIDVAEFQSTIPQEFSTNIGTEEAAETARNLINGIIQIIETETIPARVSPSIEWVDIGRTERFEILQNNKEITKLDVTDFIDDLYPFEYNRETCQRDVGLIIDSVGYDIMFGSNFRSITAGRSYYRAGAAVVTSLQKAATLDGFRYLKDLILNLVSSNATAVSRATVNMDIILDILENGISSVPSITVPSPTGYDSGFENARNLIEENRAFIKAEVIEYIADTFPSFTYDTVACARDIDYILDAVYYDMTYGGNMETIIAGNAYYSNSVIQLGEDEKDETISAYNFMKGLIVNVAQNINVNELQGTVPQEFGTAGSVEAATAAGDLIDDIISIIDDPNTPPSTVSASTTWVQPSLVSQFNNLQNNKELVKGQVTHYIDVEYVEPTFNRSKCERDVEYILDAVYYDLTYGGNMETAIAANSYFVGTNTVIPGEVEATIDAYSYMKEIIVDIAQNNPVTPNQQFIEQTFGIPGDLFTATLAGQLIQDIIDVIDNQTLITSPTPGNTSWVDQDLVDQYDLLQAEKENAKIAIGDYIDSKYFLLTYNRDKCLRDIGYIIDALGYDVMTGSNFRSIVAARSYYRINANLVLSSQKSATIGSLRRLKELLLISAGSNETAIERIEDNIELMISIINLGESAIPSYIIPNPPGYPSTFSNARNLVDANRDFIKAEVIKYIEINDPPVYASMDSEKCQRDIDYILDAIYYDITYGTNAESLVAGRSYYVGTSIQLGEGEFDTTIEAYEYLKSLVGQIAVNTLITPPLQDDVDQVLGAGGSAAAALELTTLIQEIIDYITDPDNPPEFRPADTTWVDSELVITNESFQSNKETNKILIKRYIDSKYAYSQETCARDIGYILDATVYDQLYGGNSQTTAAVETYYSAGIFQIGGRERLMTANTFKYLKSVVGSCLLNIPVVPLQDILGQDLAQPPASINEVVKSNQLFSIVSEVLENGFTSTIVLNENIPDFDPVFPGIPVTFHQYSLVTASGHTFEWVGAGVNVNTSLPYLGGLPDPEAKAVEINGGKVYWTGTDQTGDFNIGGELVIRRDSGTIEGRTFTKSLFAVLTPYILAVGE